MNKDIANKIIEKNKESYNKIAQDFDVTRKYKWPEFEILKPLVKKGSKILDIGCGNGRLFEFLSKECGVLRKDYIGIDNAEKIIRVAQKKFPKGDFKVADIFGLPFKDKEFDLVAGIAFLHHIPGEKLRLKALQEISRVLKPGGTLFLTNWNLWQWNRIKKYNLRLLDFFFAHDKMDKGDFWITFHSNRRYYHHFTKQELVRLAKKAGLKLSSCKKGMNMVTVFKK